MSSEETNDLKKATVAAAKSSKGAKRKRRSLTVNSPAVEIGQAFFQCMDFDSNGYIEEEEATMLSIIAFGKAEEEAKLQWKNMLSTMDSNNDNKISRAEYLEWWKLTSSRHCATQTNEKGEEEVVFQHDYALDLLESLQQILSIKTAKNMFDAFFFAMDHNNDGFLEESEIMDISKWAFGVKPKEAGATWTDMLEKMDTNDDQQVSKEEYGAYWMRQTKDKIHPDGTFVEGYKHHLLKKLAKIKAGNHRQAQVLKWEKEYEGDESTKKSTPKKNTRISFQDGGVPGGVDFQSLPDVA